MRNFSIAAILTCLYANSVFFKDKALPGVKSHENN
jgi:hypothetical protein